MYDRDLKRDIILLLMGVAILIAVLILSGCGSSKKTTHEQNHIQQFDSSSFRLDQIGISRLNIVSLLEQNTNKDFKMRLYDTGKPADPVTGLPPVLADIEGSEQSNSREQANITRVDSTDTEVNAASKSTLIVDQKKDAFKETKESTQLLQGAHLLWALAGLVVVCIIGCLVYKRKKKKASSKNYIPPDSVV